MRLIASLLLATFVACGARGGGDPAWPKRLDPEVDGGESLAPRTVSVISETEPEKKKETKSDETPEVTADDEKTEDKPADDAKPSTTTPTTTTDDDIIIIDDIVIEIED